MAVGRKRDWWNLLALLALVLSWAIPTDDVALAIVGKLALSAPYLIWLWARGEKKHGKKKRKKKKDVVENLLLSASTVTLVLMPVLWHGRMLLWGYLGLFILLLIIWVIFVLCNSEERKGTDATLSLVLFLQLVYAVKSYTFLSSFPSFLIGALVAGCVLSLVVILVWVNRDQGIWTRIGIFFVFAIVLTGISMSFISHLNYLLDDSEPQIVVATIEDKQRGGGRKHRYRRFVFELEGERIRLNVTSDEYSRYDVGDEYILVYYEGAFDEPYFLPGGGA